MSDTEIELFFLETNILLRELRNYLDIVDTSLNSEENRIWQHSDEFLRQSRYWETQKNRFEYFWPMAKHYSFITLLHLTIEGQLRQLCILVQSHDENLRGQKNIGRGIKDYMDFMGKSEKYNVTRRNISNWRAITDFEKVRNCIVHTFGRIEHVNKKDQRRIRDLVKTDRNSSIQTRIPKSNQLMLSFDYCTNAYSVAMSFFEEIHHQLTNKNQKIDTRRIGRWRLCRIFKHFWGIEGK